MQDPTQNPTVVSADQYWAAQPVPVQALRHSTNPQQDGMALAMGGYVIDYPCMIWYPESPGFIMLMREQMGLFWAPSALQSYPGGMLDPAFAPFFSPSPQPAGSIKVTYNPADYPPVVPPTPPSPPVVSDVGNSFGGFTMPDPVTGKACEVFSCSSQLQRNENGIYTVNGKQYRYILTGNALMSTNQRTPLWLLQS